MRPITRFRCLVLVVVSGALPGVAGAQQPYLVKDVWEGPQGSNLFELVDVGGILFFIADDGVHRTPGYYPGASRSLWRSDGTAEGTVLVKQVPARSLTRVGRRLFFATAEHELWVSDGSATGTVKVKSFAGGIDDGPVGLAAVGDVLIFRANSGPVNALWRSDGTTAGTYVLVAGTPLNATTAGGQYFYEVTTPAGSELWRTDGTIPGTGKITPVPRVSTGSFKGVSGRLFFGAADVIFGEEPWTSDGTAAGTRRLADVNPGPAGSRPSSFTAVDGFVFFVADGVTPGELWRTDGTPDGTALVARTNPSFVPIGPGFFLGPSHLTAAAHRLFFRLLDDLWAGVFGDELGASDGTTSGTGLLKDICPGPCSSQPYAFVDGGGLLYFSANDGVHGVELWRSDGTPHGTRMAADIEPGPGSSMPNSITVSGSRLFFSASRSDVGTELWALDLSPR